MAKKKTLPTRDKVKAADTWDLSSLFESDAEWDAAFAKWEKEVKKYAAFRGTLGDGPEQLAKLLKFDSKFDRAGERLAYYAMLKTTEDQGNSAYQAMIGRYQNVATKAGEAASYIRPEILGLSAAKLKKYLDAKPLAPFKLSLERLVRYKPHTLTDGEERLLAMQGEMSGAADQIFTQLTDADMKFGTVKDANGDEVELGQSSFSVFLHSAKRSVRKEAFTKFYAEFSDHENCLAAALKGSIQKDVYYAKARNYPSAREASLFSDNVPAAVYDSLIKAVRSKLPAVYKYLDVRKRKMKLKAIHHYDTYVPILSELDKSHSWDQAVKVVIESLRPLGEEYCATLHSGLTGRWCDRYPNKGKQSGAFSAGSFDGDPYIMMNYQPDVLDHVFTLTHEAGHSMHSHYSSSNQPYEYYNYTIFVAEVASTFNEQLLSRHLMQSAKSDKEKAYLLNREIDAIRGTIIRQTMFAEFEKITHELAEAGEPLTLEKFREVYRGLLDAYFGPGFVIDKELELECLRIPHFYRAFYVYKYATGLSAAIALSQRVLGGGEAELNDYLAFLKGGCSKYPLDLLRDAGVDMEKPEPVQTALSYFEGLVDELDALL
ncbi:Oligoendopeptidase F, plasmid [Posidoniimonas polymericola]|uniref:Oligopeptidase F n=1 Tax=Posidoniimonas polymericola TaxID=2528002 RepID=A0A5C5ZEV4_9BACT|nr:oligoendopeptidase F [Posidoniimonas polymericola]TWT85969.1 Oligoendopeptidase F, plasmid [Posidoniimonas polymericola]